MEFTEKELNLLNHARNAKEFRKIKARIIAKGKVKEFEKEFNTRMVSVLSTALGVVAALFWQTAITDTLKAFIPVGGTWLYEIGTAMLVTAIAVIVILLISRQPKKKS